MVYPLDVGVARYDRSVMQEVVPYLVRDAGLLLVLVNNLPTS